MQHRCKKENCKSAGKSCCGACQSEWYCSVECQRSDWKAHKITCGKRLLPVLELQDYVERTVQQARRYEAVGEKVKAIALYEKTLISCEYQFGEHIRGTCYRRRKNGDRIKEWQLFSFRNMITESYIQQRTVASSDSALKWAIETRAALEARRGNSDDRSLFFAYLHAVETHLSDIYEAKADLQKALHHRQEALAAAKHDGPGFSQELFNTLNSLASLHTLLNTGEGITFSEEAYNIVVNEYGPEHIIAQTATMTLIGVYLEAGRFLDAGRFARINYEDLTRSKTGPDKELVAMSKMQVARAWLLTPPDQCTGGPAAAEEAETLAREACNELIIHKMTGVEDTSNSNLASCYGTLADVMMARGDVSSDVESVLQRALSLSQSCRVGIVPLVKGIADRNCYLGLLGKFYVRSSATMSIPKEAVSELEKALYAYHEMHRICVALYDPSDDRVLNAQERITSVLSSICERGGGGGGGV
jgi:tetratricopeptide (TPR) repeat protein